jgi:hypothetical protein
MVSQMFLCCLQAGQQVMDKAQGAAEPVKNAVGMNK